MRHIIALLLITVTGAGCASPPLRPAVSAEDIKVLAGAWQGWMVTERSFDLINFEIRPDGSFEVTGRWVRASGILVISDGRLRFDGTGPWRGTLVPEGTGERRTLSLERDDRLYRGTLHPISHAG